MNIWLFIENHLTVTVILILLLIWLVLWFYNTLTRGVCKSHAQMYGKTIIITGCDTGIGKETAFELARRGAKVIMACIEYERALAVKEDIIKATKNSDIVVKFVDLSSLQSVRNFAEEINKSEPKLDVLIHNAGILMAPRPKSVDGLNMILATNHFGPFLLNHLLIDLLKKSSQGRVVTVASRMHTMRGAEVDPNNPNPLEDIPSKKFNLQMYVMSKFACIICAKEMARRLQGRGVTVNTLHPGLVVTTIAGACFPNVLYTVFPYVCPITKTPKQGAQTSIHLAVSEKVEGVSGQYFSNCKIISAAKKTDDLELAKKYWRVCEEVVQLKPSDPRI